MRVYNYEDDGYFCNDEWIGFDEFYLTPCDTCDLYSKDKCPYADSEDFALICPKWNGGEPE